MPGSTDPPCVFLEWDSAHFGLRIARVPEGELTPSLMREVDAWCADNAIDCIYYLAGIDDPESRRVAGRNGFDLVDVRVELSRGLAGGGDRELSTNGAGAAVRRATGADLSPLKAIAGESHTNTRFYRDGRFAAERCRSMYEIWMEKCVNDDSGFVVVADVDGDVVGYVTGGTDSEGRGLIGLVGVKDAVRGRNIGSRMVRGALAGFREQGVEVVRVATQGENVAAQRLYQRCGFLTDSLYLWHHKWFRTP
jgi:ribosomal protein S18 acetylase RimI-like enzyme